METFLSHCLIVSDIILSMKTLDYFFYILLYISRSLAVLSDASDLQSHKMHRGQNSTILLHIGPPKTGSTYIQQQLRLLSENLLMAGICVKTDEYSKEQNQLANMLIDPQGGYSYDSSHIQDCIARGGRPIISSETLATFKTEEEVGRLRTVLGEHNVHVVLYYREPSTLFYSHYTELTKNLHPFHPFSTFMINHFDAHISTLAYDFIDLYVSVFGREHVTVLDYYGILAAKKDILQVMLCDVYNVLCDAKLVPVENVNKSPDMLPYHLFNIVKNFMFTMGCKPINPLTKFDVAHLISNYSTKAPKDKLSLTLLHSTAYNMDEAVRKEYGDIMLYSNATAGAEAREKLEIFELDEELFWPSDKWSSWVQKEVMRMVRMKNLFDCTYYLKEMRSKLLSSKKSIRKGG